MGCTLLFTYVFDDSMRAVEEKMLSEEERLQLSYPQEEAKR